MMLKKYTLIVLAALAPHSADAKSLDWDPSVFSFNGFGTVAAVHSTEDRADYTASFFKPTGAGFSHGWSFDTDSLLAFQVTAKLSDKLTAVVQVLAQQQWDDRYTPAIEWANLKYSFTPNFSVRAGRIAMPTYLSSDVRNVFYSIIPVRQYPEIYNLLPVGNSNGVDASYRLQIGKVSNTIQALYGEAKAEVAADFSTRATGMWGVFDTVEYGSLLLHFAYQGQQLHLENPAQPSNALPFKIVEAGTAYDNGTLYLSAEWARKFLILGDSKALALNAGYRIDKLTPYLGYARMQRAGPPKVGNAAEQNTATAGVRWDFMRNFDVKAQIDRIKNGKDSFGILKNIQPDLAPGGSYRLFSVAVDFVF